MLIELEQVEFGYDSRVVLHVERMELRAGWAIGIFGPNGTGKTTLVRGITGLLPPMSGRVLRQGEVRIAYLPQHSAMESHWPMSGFDAAAMAMSARRPLGRLGGRWRQDVFESMRAMNVVELADQQFFALSGGQQQRLLLAGAMAIRPQLLVLDEPTAGLDVHSRRVLLDALTRAIGQGLCVVMISHEIEDLVETCRQVVWLHPADEFGGPGRTELTHPRELASRLVTTGTRR